MQATNLYNLSLPELEAQLQVWGHSPDQARAYARTIWQGLFQSYVTDIQQLEDLPPTLRERLAETFFVPVPDWKAHEVSTDERTRKDLLEMTDGAQIETVLLRYRERYTVCVSTQVGCACGCRFCATGQMGFQRNLAPGEILSQILHYQRQLAERGQNISNVVFMGMGEPLLNAEATLDAVRTLVEPRGLAFAPGRITLSTVGIVPGIQRLAEIHPQFPIKLAISLHAATDTLRDLLMPINVRYPLANLFDAARSYTHHTGRHVFFEWVMIEGVNDTPEQAAALAAWLQSVPAHVNLIELNPTDCFPGKPSSPEAVTAFAAMLDEYQIPHTMRQRRGGGITAGCGQLRTTRGSPAPSLS